jgi:heat shock protein HslJ
MRLRLALSAFLVSCLPADARDLSLSITWDNAADAEMVTVLHLADGTVASVTRTNISADMRLIDQLLTDLPRQASFVQVALMDQSRILAQSAPKALERGDAPLALTLSPVLALSLRSVFDCGDAGVATLTTQGQVTRLSLARNGSEVARLLASDGPLAAPDGTKAQVNGTLLTLSPATGDAIPCPALPAPPVLPVVARAQDDTWQVTLDATQASVTLPTGTLTEGEAIAPVGAGQVTKGAIVFGSPQFTLTLRNMRCLRGPDTVPYPLSAGLTLASGVAASDGCAGNPLDLLVGQAWSVTTLLGVPILQDMTLGFAAGQVTGRGTCNRYQANVSFDAGQMHLRDLGTTRVGCSIALRNLELRFLDALEQADGFTLGAEGTLTLRVGPMPVLTAQQRKAPR